MPPDPSPATALAQLRQLRTPAGKVALAHAAELVADRVEVLPALARLRTAVGVELAGPAWELARLRARARPVFGADADALFFTADTLEQAGRPALAARRAARLLADGTDSVADLGCAAGTDTIALARAGARVLAVDLDPIARELTTANAAVLGLSDDVLVVADDAVELVASARGGRGRRLRGDRPRPGPPRGRATAARPRPLVPAVVDGRDTARPRAASGGEGGARARPRPGARGDRGRVGLGRRVHRRGGAVGARGLAGLAPRDARARRGRARADRRRRPGPARRPARYAAGCTSPIRR